MGIRINKKRFLVFVTIIVLVIGISAALFIRSRFTVIDSIVKADSISQIIDFYNSAIPGLERAEDLKLVKYISRSYDIPENEGIITIDRLWYNNNNAYVLYNIERTKKYGILSGEMYVHYEENQSPELSWISSGIGSESTRGILYNGKFYSFVKLDIIDGAKVKNPDSIINIAFTPRIVVKNYNMESFLTEEDIIHDLGTLEIEFRRESVEEKINKIELDGDIIIDERPMKIYRIDIGTSVNRLYFEYNNNDKDIMYRAEGRIITNHGEERDITGFTKVTTDYPYHYTLEFKPFNKFPDSFQVVIDNVKLISGKSISFNINTADFKGKKNEERVVGKLLSTFMNTNVILDRYLWNENGLGFELSYEVRGDIKPQFKKVIPEVPVTGADADKYENAAGIYTRFANIVQITNDWNIHGSYGDFGIRGITSGNRMLVYINDGYVRNCNVINVVINNLSYEITIKDSVNMEVLLEEE